MCRRRGGPRLLLARGLALEAARPAPDPTEVGVDAVVTQAAAVVALARAAAVRPAMPKTKKEPEFEENSDFPSLFTPVEAASSDLYRKYMVHMRSSPSGLLTAKILTCLLRCDILATGVPLSWTYANVTHGVRSDPVAAGSLRRTCMLSNGTPSSLFMSNVRCICIMPITNALKRLDQVLKSEAVNPCGVAIVSRTFLDVSFWSSSDKPMLHQLNPSSGSRALHFASVSQGCTVVCAASN